MSEQWSTPTPIDDVTLAFPANALDLMPSREECEVGLAELSEKDRRKWIDFQSQWFSCGLPEGVELHMRDGIDGEIAFRHLSAIQGSFAPKHEHKMEAVAYLASRWIKKVEIQKSAGHRRPGA
jgi:hypothetical protein